MAAKRNLMDILSDEHREVTELLEELTAIDGDDGGRREAMFERLSDALVEYVEAEQDVLCPALKETPSTIELADDALGDHADVRRVLEQLELLDPEDDGWLERLYDLRDVVERHVVQEEQELFERARQAFSDERLADLGRRFLEHRQAHRPV